MIEQKEQTMDMAILPTAPAGFVPIKEYAEQIGRTSERIAQMIKEGKLVGRRVVSTTRVGYSWYVRPSTSVVPMGLIREAAASVALDHDERAQTSSGEPPMLHIVSPTPTGGWPQVTDKQQKITAPPAAPSLPSADDILVGILQQRGLNWRDMALHLQLVAEDQLLVKRWLAVNDVSAFLREVMAAHPAPQVIVANTPGDPDWWRDTLSTAERELADARKELITHKARTGHLTSLVNELQVRVDERNVELTRQQAMNKSLEVLVAELKRKLTDRASDDEKIRTLTAARDVHAQNAAKLTQQLSGLEGVKAGLISERNSLNAQLQDERKMVNFQDIEIKRLMALLARRDVAHTSTESTAPVEVSNAVMGCLRAIMDPTVHPSGHAYLVSAPFDAKEVLKQMRRSSDGKHKVAINWIEANPDLYHAGVEHGFTVTGETNGRVFRPGE